MNPSEKVREEAIAILGGGTRNAWIVGRVAEALTLRDQEIEQLKEGNESLKESLYFATVEMQKAEDKILHEELLRASEVIRLNPDWPHNCWPSQSDRCWHVAAKREIEQLKRQLDSKVCDHINAPYLAVIAERDQLKAEVERLKNELSSRYQIAKGNKMLALMAVISERDAQVAAMREAINTLIGNSRLGPDPGMDGATDTYLVPVEDVEALRALREKEKK